MVENEEDLAHGGVGLETSQTEENQRRLKLYTELVIFIFTSVKIRYKIKKFHV